MKHIVFIFIVCAFSLKAGAQVNWIKNFELFLGYGMGVGDVNSGKVSYNGANSINHFTPTLTLEYSDYVLPVSIEYDITSSRYSKKGVNYYISSQYLVHKAGIGYKINDNVPIKLKYIFINHYSDLFSKTNHGIHTSFGVERDKSLKQIFPNNQVNITYRIMIYFEHTFGVFDGAIQNLPFYYGTPYRNVTGVSFWIKPWRNKERNRYRKDILPPFS